ncbi:hypothetical protein VP01_2466g2 [Puccinia sorghi]|uniref:Uncharacterized protein n=1 Tax=Puccinia sorghi TaxID=27349 RepID=A0A0L6V7W6_9BASI|nr:hypothetical protein VP01_2466g2 [Puccinia sorghi]
MTYGQASGHIRDVGEFAYRTFIVVMTYINQADEDLCIRLLIPNFFSARHWSPRKRWLMRERESDQVGSLIETSWAQVLLRGAHQPRAEYGGWINHGHRLHNKSVYLMLLSTVNPRIGKCPKKKEEACLLILQYDSIYLHNESFMKRVSLQERYEESQDIMPRSSGRSQVKLKLIPPHDRLASAACLAMVGVLGPEPINSTATWSIYFLTNNTTSLPLVTNNSSSFIATSTSHTAGSFHLESLILYIVRTKPLLSPTPPHHHGEPIKNPSPSQLQGTTHLQQHRRDCIETLFKKTENKIQYQRQPVLTTHQTTPCPNKQNIPPFFVFFLKKKSNHPFASSHPKKLIEEHLVLIIIIINLPNKIPSLHDQLNTRPEQEVICALPDLPEKPRPLLNKRRPTSLSCCFADWAEPSQSNWPHSQAPSHPQPRLTQCHLVFYSQAPFLSIPLPFLRPVIHSRCPPSIFTRLRSCPTQSLFINKKNTPTFLSPTRYINKHSSPLENSTSPQTKLHSETRNIINIYLFIHTIIINTTSSTSSKTHFNIS